MTRLATLLLIAACGSPGASATGSTSAALTGSGWAWHTIAPYDHRGGHGADGATPCDWNGDGRTDLVTAWEQGHSITVHLAPPYDPAGHPRWAEAPWTPVEIAHDPALPFEGAQCVDVDGDGGPDVIGAAQIDGALPVVYRAGQAPMVLANPGGGHRWLDTLIVDMNGDGRLDVVGMPATKEVFVWTQPATITDPWPVELAALARHVMAAHAVDVDSDGDLDLVLSVRRTGGTADLQGLWWAEQGTTGGPEGTWTRHPIGPPLSAMMSCRRSDGVIAQPYRAPGRLALYTPTATPTDPWDEEVIPLPVLGGTDDLKGCAWGDMDGDQDDDLVLVTHEQETAWIAWCGAEDAGTGCSWTWEPIEGDADLRKVDAPVLHDVDGDGDLDVVLTDEGAATPDARGLGWLENPL